MDEVLWCDGLGFVVRADEYLEMMIGGDEAVRIGGDGAVGEGIVIGITDDGMETVRRADVVDGNVEEVNQRFEVQTSSQRWRLDMRTMTSSYSSSRGVETAKVNLPWRSASRRGIKMVVQPKRWTKALVFSTTRIMTQRGHAARHGRYG